MKIAVINEHDSANVYQQAVQLLRQGRLVAFPTETVYGLGADASNPQAVAKIFAAKGRPCNHPLIVHIGHIEQLKDWAENIPQMAYQLAAQFWPGPLAMILQKKPSVPEAVTGGQKTVALRMPDNGIALQLLRQFGGGIAAPSANRFNRISPTRAQHVAEELGTNVDLILDGGACSVGLESSIVDLSGGQAKLLRPGKIGKQQIEQVIGMRVAGAENSEVKAPGMLEVHYAPSTLTVRCPAATLPELLQTLQVAGKRSVVLLHSLQLAESPIVKVMRLPPTVVEYAQGLYQALREMDRLKMDIIIVEQPTENEQWNAINDRLKKAAAPLSVVMHE